MKHPRFALRSLFIFLTLAAAFFGYSQWRRQRIMHEVRELESQGFTLLWQHRWTDWIWPVVPKDAKCEYYVSGGKWKIGLDVYNLDEEGKIDAHYLRACDRLNALGVESVRLDRDGKPSNNYTSTKHGPH